ncbi:MAG: hypothetical protein KAS48_07520 [Gammaproteobacteria bacterium]|nr:hypothetical protein [Gammaproteobacteria bacterium]MCK5092683.1 hypothetical protein [Gammaproteobacteria bacterium]
MNKPKHKSSAGNPDLDWSQIKETVLLLHAATAQIQSSMTEGEESVTALTESFTTLVGKTSIIGEAAESLKDSTEKQTILSNYHDVLDQVQSAIVAFQFYDRMTQRLEHVSHSLGSLAELIGEHDRVFSPYEWKGLQKTIQSRYTNESDRTLFEAILDGASVDKALKLAKEKAAQEKDDDIELF